MRDDNARYKVINITPTRPYKILSLFFDLNNINLLPALRRACLPAMIMNNEEVMGIRKPEVSCLLFTSPSHTAE